MERHLLRNFIKYAEHRPDARHDSVWHWMALAQHHGLPSRMLDWSYSPLVALHFVTEISSAFDEDGGVWCVDYQAVKRALPPLLRHVLDEEASDVFTLELLGEAAASLESFATSAANRHYCFSNRPLSTSGSSRSMRSSRC